MAESQTPEQRTVRKAAERQIAAVERQVAALNLRKAGVDYRRIAAELGYSGPSSAHYAVKTALKKTRQEAADEVRHLELERLDVMLNSLWPSITEGKRAAPRAAEVALKVMDRRAALLGLDAPVKREDQIRITFETAAREVADQLGMDVDDVMREVAVILGTGVDA